MARAKATSKTTDSEPQPSADEIRDDEELLEGLLSNTHAMLKQAVDRAGPKRVARSLDVSLSLVYKWTQPPRSKSNPTASGARNPLDKLVTIYALSEDLELIQFLCRVGGGYYTANPASKGRREASFVTATVAALNDFADLMHLAEKSLSDDGRIDEYEAVKLRKYWDRLKGRLEHFIVACEEGHFDRDEDGRMEEE